MKKYLVFIRCELGDRDNYFISHYKFFDDIDEAEEWGCQECDELSQYPMCCGFDVYTLFDADVDFK